MVWYGGYVKQLQIGRRKVGPMRKETKFLAQVILFFTAVIFVCIGVWRGEADTVFAKAVRLCLECVGIG